MPSIGSIVEGYLLLNMKYHIPSFGNLNEKFLDEFLSLKDEIRDALEHIYKTGCIFYEHGRAGSSLKLDGGDIISYHAHIHCVAVDVDILTSICKDYEPIKINNWKEVVRLEKKYHHYLYYEDNEKNMFFFPVHTYTKPQYLRSALAEEINDPSSADWRKKPNWGNIENSVKKLSLHFSKKEVSSGVLLSEL